MLINYVGPITQSDSITRMRDQPLPTTRVMRQRAWSQNNAPALWSNVSELVSLALAGVCTTGDINTKPSVLNKLCGYLRLYRCAGVLPDLWSSNWVWINLNVYVRAHDLIGTGPRRPSRKRKPVVGISTSIVPATGVEK